MKTVTPKLTGIFSRWMGLSKSASVEQVPMQLIALEERILYSAGPVPAEVMDVELLSQGDFQEMEASDLGLNSLETESSNTLEYLQQQIDAANAFDSFDAIEPLELVPIELDDEVPLVVEPAESSSNEIADAAFESDISAVATDLQGNEREIAAVSAELESGLSISGRIFHDVDGDGSIDENQIFEDVEVRLYTVLGNGRLSFLDILDVRATTTNEDGYYEFTNLDVGEDYFIVANSLTLGENLDYNSGYSADDVWGVQTYAAQGALSERGSGRESLEAGAFYGGFSADRSDRFQFSLFDRGFEHVIWRPETTVDQVDVDFGFSFNVVTNTLGGDLQNDDLDSNRTVQGSLRQFIANANAIAGDNELRFVPVTNTSDTPAANHSYRIDIEAALPEITDAGTTIDGRAYRTDGSLITTPGTPVSSNGSINGVGVQDFRSGPNSQSILELSGTSSDGGAGLIAIAENFEVSNLAVVNFSTGIVVEGEEASSAFIHNNFIGVHADGRQASQAQNNGIVAINADEGRILNNFIADSLMSGINIGGSVDLNTGAGDHAEDWRIENNYIVVNDNVTSEFFSDGIRLTRGTDNAVVINNRIENSMEFGIDLWNNRGAVTIEQNTIVNSGSIRPSDGTLVGGGIGLTSEGNRVLNNEIVDSVATGILVRGTAEFGDTNIQSATGNLISSNYFENNAGLDIDTTRPKDLPLDDFGALEISAGDGLDDLDGQFDGETGSRGIDHPVLTGISLSEDLLTIEGSYFSEISDPQIELYLLGGNESRRHFATINVADFASYDSATGEFIAELAIPAIGWPADLEVGSEVAAIIIDGDSSDTSEFSVATSVTTRNVPAVFTTLENEFVVAENFNGEITDLDSEDPDSANGQTRYSIVGGNDGGLFNVTSRSGRLSFITSPDFENPNGGVVTDEGIVYSLIVRVDDAQGFGTERDFTVTVTDVDEIATFENSSFTQQENQIVSFFLIANADDDSLFRYELLPGGSGEAFTLNENTGEFSLKQAPDFENPTDANAASDNIYSFTVKAISNTGYVVTEDIDVTVLDIHEVATLDERNFTQQENRIVPFQLNPEAIDGSTFSYELDAGGDSEAFHLDEDTGVFLLKVAPDFENPANREYSFTVTATSTTGFTITEDVNLIVTDINEAAQTADDSLMLEALVVSEFSIADFIVANDFDGDSNLSEFSVSVVEGPSQGTIAIDNENGNVVFTPFATFTGLDSFQYQLVSIDGQVQSDTSQVSIELLQTPEPPTPDSPTSSIVTLVPVEPEDNQVDLIDNSNAVTEDVSPEFVGVKLPMTTMGEEAEAIPSSLISTIEPVVNQQGYVTPEDVFSSENQVGLNLEIGGNVYSYFGRTQFLELANLELSEFEIRDSIHGESDQNNQVLLSQLILGSSEENSPNDGDAPILSFEKLIRQNVSAIGWTTVIVASFMTGLTVTGSQVHRFLDVGSLLDDDESIEDIVSS